MRGSVRNPDAGRPDSDTDIRGLRRILTESIALGAWPGCVVAGGHATGAAFEVAAGTHTPGSSRRTRVTDLFDLASLTKAVATTAATMLLVDRGIVDPSRPVADYLPHFARAGGARAGVTVRHLLAHCSGLPAYRPLWREFPGRSPAELTTAALETPLAAPPGERAVYSDIGFIVLGVLLEAASGRPLDVLCRDEVFAPLGMTDTCWNPGEGLLPRIVPTECPAGGGEPIRGRVHDENASALGGVSGHAGLFSTASDLARFARGMLLAGMGCGGLDVRPETVRLFTVREGSVSGSSRALGWDTPDGESCAGPHASPRAYGHTGFTGTSLWLDPGCDVYGVLLSNAVHPRRENKAVAYFRCRRVVHGAVYGALGQAAGGGTHIDLAPSSV